MLSYFDNTLLIPGPADPVPPEACRTAARSKLSRKDWKRRLVMHRLLFALPLLLLTAAAPPDVTGHWVTEDGTGLIAISRCGNSVCGKVAKALVIKPGHPKTDVKNPDPALRKRPVIGMTVMRGVKAEDGEIGRESCRERGGQYA